MDIFVKVNLPSLNFDRDHYTGYLDFSTDASIQ